VPYIKQLVTQLVYVTMILWN